MAGLMVGCCLSVVAFASSQDGTPQMLRAQRFQLVDDTGYVWIDLEHDSDETGMFVLDAAGTVRIGVAQFAHGGGGFALHGSQGHGAAVLPQGSGKPDVL
jgi:hypothetical protein